MADPFAHLLLPPDNTPYSGLFVASIPKGGQPRLVKMRQVREGAMREFLDPISGEVVGCCGINWAAENVKIYHGD